MENKFDDFVSIQLNKEESSPLYVQLYMRLREMILAGTLSHGYVLPPVRKFAAFLGVNVGTVVNAYRELEKNGYIFSRTGSGSYVAELPQSSDQSDEFESEALDVFIPSFAESYINLASIALNPEMISVDILKDIINTVLDRDQGYAFSYQESQGFYPLRESIAAYLQAQGVKADAGNVQIISGAQQGIDIVAKALLQHGDYVFTERPTYPGAIAAFKSRGAKIVDIHLDDEGMVIEELEENLKKFRPKLIYVMPNIQNPTGCSYTSVRRSRIVGLARYYGAFILEDDYISELTYETEPMAPLKALDRDDRIIYLKSFSKIFMPGLRLAFLTIPAGLIQRVLGVKYNSDISTSGLTQRAFDLYLRDGAWQGHIDSLRCLYSAQFLHLLRVAEACFPPYIRYRKPVGGLSLWLVLPKGMSAQRIAAAAKEHNVLLTEGTAFFSRQAPDRYLRISFATANREEIEVGLSILGQLFRREEKKQ